MSYKSHLFPSSGCETPISIGPSWGSSSANLQDVKLVNPWIDYDSRVRPGLARRIKWNTVLGLAFATTVSASIWTGIVVMIARIWK